MITYSALVQPVPASFVADLDKRTDTRHHCDREAVTRPMDLPNSISWGATVRDFSKGGIGLSLCYPFKRGTYLALELQGPGIVKTMLARVVHVKDRSDGNWHIGCEFVTPLSEAELAKIFPKG